MERLVVALALITAAVFAASSFWGSGPFSIHINDDGDDDVVRIVGAADVGAAAGAPITAAPYAAKSVRIVDAAAVITVTPEDRSDILVQITGGGQLPALKARIEGDRLVLDGGLDNRIRNCGDGRVTVSGVGDLPRAQLPRVVLRVPRDVDLAVEDAVSGEVGAARTARIAMAGCGDLVLGPVEGELKLAASGSGEVKGATAGALDLSQSGSSDIDIGDVKGAAKVSIAGSGDSTVGAVGGGLKASIAGSGSIAVDRVAGRLDTAIAGSGDVTIRSGRPSPVEVSIAGSGGVEIDGPVGDLKVSIMGSGDVAVGAVEGKLEQSVLGSGDVRIGG